MTAVAVPAPSAANGRLTDGERNCRDILARQPEHFDALYSLGLLRLKAKDNEAAAELLSRAAALRPWHLKCQTNLAVALQGLGRPDEAITVVRRALVFHPGSADGYYNLAQLLHMRGRKELAVAGYRRTIDLNPRHAPAYNNLGACVQSEKTLAEAETCYRRAVTLQPDYHQALNNLGNLLRTKGVAVEGLPFLRRALAVKPDYADAHNNLGIVYKDLHQFDEATACFHRALALRPDYERAYNNLGMTYQAGNRLAEAIAAYGQAIAISPDYVDAHANRALAMLTGGHLGDGWPEYEWRWKLKQMSRPDFQQPPWEGEAVAGRAVLVYNEQGLGDTIQFGRYATLLAQRGARVVLQVQPALRKLMAGLPGVAAVVARGSALPPFDFHCAMLSLPRVFGTDLHNVPASVPYIRLPADRVAAWGQRLGRRQEPRVGVVWAGNPKHKNNANRSIPLEALLPVLSVPGIRFISLQVGERSRDVQALPAGLSVEDMSPALGDFVETAALMRHLDLVICVDTSVAHLAGALARPVWVMTPFAPDWRWLLDREDTAWYPTMRLIRQSRPGAWADVIERVAGRLRALVRGGVE